MQILLATNNLHKKVELSALWPRFEILLPVEVGLKSWTHDETEVTFRGNSLGKALSLFGATNGAFPVVADDSGICVDALGGAPGVYSARYGEIETGHPLTDHEKNDLLLFKMTGQANRCARFVCCLSLVVSQNREFLVQETWEGEIAHKASGTHGFGYDPIFLLPDLGLVSAELEPAKKNLLSHRGRAAQRLGVLLDDLVIHP